MVLLTLKIIKLFCLSLMVVESWGEALSSPIIGAPFTGHTQTFLSIGSFDAKSRRQKHALSI